jgi:DNA repair exonuclease SbcCD ATPase subunit
MMDDLTAPASNGDVQEAVGALEVRIDTRFRDFEQRLETLLNAMEARIITASYRLAEAIQQRLKQTEGNQAAFNARLAMLEERLTELEKLLNIPPERTQ